MSIGHLMTVEYTAEREEESFEKLLREGGNTHSTVSMLQDLKVIFPTVSILFPSTSLQTQIEIRGCMENVRKKRKRKSQINSTLLISISLEDHIIYIKAKCIH